MADSPAKRHLSRVRAAQEAAKRRDNDPMDGASEYHVQMLKLQDHRVRLKAIQSDVEKANFKRSILPEYGPYLEGVLQADAGGADDVVTHCMLWAIDAGEYVYGLDLAKYVLAHGLKMPDRFARTTGCLVAEEIAEAALTSLAAGGTFDTALLARAGELTAKEDMPDEVRAKLYLAAGRVVMRDATEEKPPSLEVMQECVADLRSALALHINCGGKKDLERAERLLKNLTEKTG